MNRSFEGGIGPSADGGSIRAADARDYSSTAIGVSAFFAGPLMTSPVAPKRDPWHGQSHVRSVGFHPTVHPM
jgi:hypothetical protein